MFALPLQLPEQECMTRVKCGTKFAFLKRIECGRLELSHSCVARIRMSADFAQVLVLCSLANRLKACCIRRSVAPSSIPAIGPFRKSERCPWSRAAILSAMAREGARRNLCG